MRAKFKIKTKKVNIQSGFTLVELLVTVTLMAAVNGLILASVPDINKRIGLKRTAGEIAMIIRQAQSQAMGIKERNTDEFPGYGVHFDKTAGKNGSIILFADTLEDGKDYGDGIYDAGDGCGLSVTECVQEYTINTGDKIESLCVGTSYSNCDEIDEVSGNTLDIVFNRATPFSNINNKPGNSFAKVTIKSPRGDDKNTKEIQILSSGQIEIK